jgi:hypothetical protein
LTSGGLRGLDHVPGIDQALAGAAADRRADVGVAEIDLGGLDGGLVEGDGAHQRIDGGLLLVVALARLVA